MHNAKCQMLFPSLSRSPLPRRSPAQRVRAEATSNDTRGISRSRDMELCVMRQGADAPSKLNIVTVVLYDLANTLSLLKIKLSAY